MKCMPCKLTIEALLAECSSLACANIFLTGEILCQCCNAGVVKCEHCRQIRDAKAGGQRVPELHSSQRVEAGLHERLLCRRRKSKHTLHRAGHRCQGGPSCSRVRLPSGCSSVRLHITYSHLERHCLDWSCAGSLMKASGPHKLHTRLPKTIWYASKKDTSFTHQSEMCIGEESYALIVSHMVIMSSFCISLTTMQIAW